MKHFFLKGSIALTLLLSIFTANALATTAEEIEKLNSKEFVNFIDSLEHLEIVPENCRLERNLRYMLHQYRKGMSPEQRTAILKKINSFSDKCWEKPNSK